MHAQCSATCCRTNESKRGYQLLQVVAPLVGDAAEDGDEVVLKLTPPQRSFRMNTIGKVVAVVVILLGAALVGVFMERWQDDADNVATAIATDRSIAVLPFVNISSDIEQEYFSDGISEELLNLLSKVPELRVISRTSAFSFKDKGIDIPTIAEQLNVAYVLEGSVRKSGNQLRISAQLIEARSDTHLWSETFDRTLDDIFGTQDEIAARVVEQLKVKLLGDTPTVQATDPEAYALVLQARYLGQQLTPDGLGKSIALFEQALVIDPDYAAAWAGLASGYANQANQGLRPVDEGYAQAREAASQALALDPAYGPAHHSLARIAQHYDRDLVTAARHYERAVALDSADTDSIASAATMAADLGRLDQAIALAEYAVARDPVSPIRNANLGVNYLEAGRLDKAIASLRAALTLSPGFISAQYSIGMALLFKGEPESALAAMQNEASEGWRLIGLVSAYHVLGQAAASNAALETLIEKYEKDAAYNIAYVLAFRGEADRAFEWLNKALAYNDPGLAEIAIQPLFRNIHSDPRWLPFLESIGKSPEQLAAIKFEVTLPK
jgi:TolB-like protein